MVEVDIDDDRPVKAGLLISRTGKFSS